MATPLAVLDFEIRPGEGTHEAQQQQALVTRQLLEHGS
jgi:hypothetical protein